MPLFNDQDRFFDGNLDASIPKSLLPEGSVARIINGRFVEGAITNAIGFDELPVVFGKGVNTRLPTSNTTFQDILVRGDVQLAAPLENITGKFLVVVISGILFRIDIATCMAADITPKNACLPGSSHIQPLSYVDNDGGTYGVGGYLVIFNWPNKTIFVTSDGARLARTQGPFWETPPARMGATAGNRLFIISGENLMYASDPLGGADSLAPLTFQETLDPTGAFFGQVFTIGSALDIEHITAICRLPRYFGSAQAFLAQSLLVSAVNHKYTVAASAARATWEPSQFISYAGSADGISGSLACTNIGDVVSYIANTGRTKTIGQDTEFATGLSETFLDDPLGQYLCHCEASLYYRKWYENLDHSRSIVTFNKSRLYATVYPIQVPAIDRFGGKFFSPSHRALAIGSLDSTTRLGPTASIAWEGFYDWIKPIGIVTIDNVLYVVSKDEYGHIRYYKQNLEKVDEHSTTIYTRGYLFKAPGKVKSLSEITLYFRRLNGPITVRISYLINDEWICGANCTVSSKLQRFSFRDSRCKTDDSSVPLKIDIDHNGCKFELATINVEGELFKDSK